LGGRSSILFDLMDSYRFLRIPDLLPSLTAGKFLSTDGRARCGAHIRN
jgi:hypothetical protein